MLALDELTTLDRILTIQPTARIERLRQAFLDLQPSASIDRARIETRVLKETEGQPIITRRSKVFAAVVREMPIDIYADELLVGCASARPRCVNIDPMNARALAGMRASESNGIGRGAPRDLTDEETRELKEEMTPYWSGQGRTDKAFHYGHNIHDYAKVLKKGFLGIKLEAEERLARIDPADPEEFEKIPFLEGVIRAMEAVAEIGTRYAARARELAETENDPARRSDLLRIAEVCDWVPANPARTFHEAIQSYIFTFMLLHWEVDGLGSSHGKVDQYLHTYYEEDIEEGRTTKEEAQELIDCFIVKWNFEATTGAFSVGGIKPNGNDATNDLTHMVIEGMMHTRLVMPRFAVLIHSKTPDDLLIKACELCSLGTGHPQFINCDVMVSQALARGTMGGPPITLEDARSATNVGCIELVIPGKDSGYFYYRAPNLGTCMELVMTNGVRRTDGKRIGVETGDPRKFTSFEEVQEAYLKQLEKMRRDIQIEGSIQERDIMELSPTVYESALLDDCIEKGICREFGGAHYNFNNGGAELASSDVGDSLTAIKKLVFEDEKLTMAQLCDALDKDFKNGEDVRQMLRNAPKFGNDDDYADEQVVWVLHEWMAEFNKIRNLRGGCGCPGGSPMWAHVPAGRAVGALPSGRHAWMPLADAASPCPGADLMGPTAVLKSMGKVDNVEILGGVVLNLRFGPEVFEGGDLTRMVNLVRAFIDQQIYHLQVNIVSSDELKAAKVEPEKYRELIVKVAGYNAYFTELSDALQDSIIARTEHGM
jgi:formate C-acetyltransferase